MRTSTEPFQSTTGCPDPTLHLPRILCLHGGGTNSRIFRAQCRIIRRHVEHSFRLVFPDAPYHSKPGPDVTSVYADWGPFRSWTKPQTGALGYPFSTPPHLAHRVLLPADEWHPSEVIAAIDAAITESIDRDDAAGATGQWVGLLGFSQGAKLAASLLLREQYLTELSTLSYQSRLHNDMFLNFRFAVLLAGRGPLVTLHTSLESFFGSGEDVREPVLKLPTVHVHGLQDEGLAFHRSLRDLCCVAESTKTVEWEGNHRVPIKAPDVAAVVRALTAIYEETKEP